MRRYTSLDFKHNGTKYFVMCEGFDKFLGVDMIGLYKEDEDFNEILLASFYIPKCPKNQAIPYLKEELKYIFKTEVTLKV